MAGYEERSGYMMITIIIGNGRLDWLPGWLASIAAATNSKQRPRHKVESRKKETSLPRSLYKTFK